MNNQKAPSKTGLFSGAQVVLLDFLLALVLIAALVLFYNGLLFSRVQGRTMDPTYKNGDFLLCTRDAAPKRQDIVYFRAEGAMLGDRETGASLRRVIGLPGETVEILEDGTVTVNGQLLEEPYLSPETQKSDSYREDGIHSLTLVENEYFVLGDTRDISVDSRDYGPISQDIILGRALRNPNIVVYIFTIIAPLCAVLILFCLMDRTLRLLERK